MISKLKKFLSWSAIPFLCMIPLLAYAADPAPDLTTSILALWQAIQSHAGTPLILMIVIQILRTNELVGVLGKLSGRYLQVVIAVITTVGFVVSAMVQGQPIGTAIITGLFTSGGAMLCYSAIASLNNHANDPAPPAAPLVKV